MARGVCVVTLVSDVPTSRRLRYVGVDNIAAGRTAGTLLGRFAGGRSRPVGGIIGSPGVRDPPGPMQGLRPGLSPDPRQVPLLPAPAGPNRQAASAHAAC